MKFYFLGAILLISTQVFANAKKGSVPVYEVLVTEKGYEPSTLKIAAKTPVILKLTRKTNATCAREITVPSQKINVKLPLNQEVKVELQAMEKGEVKFGCAMDLMIGGVIHVE